MVPQFAAHVVWARLLGMGEREDAARLAHEHAHMFAAPRTAAHVRLTLQRALRLVCAGSAPLPETLFKKWEEVCIHVFSFSTLPETLFNNWEKVVFV
jgi:hypothetical protein